MDRFFAAVALVEIRLGNRENSQLFSCLYTIEGQKGSLSGRSGGGVESRYPAHSLSSIKMVTRLR